jgi:putative endonuclease
MKSYSVYILECADGSLYTGYTVDVRRRLEMHRSGKGAKYTRSHRPLRIVYQEAFQDKSAALRREAEIKSMPRAAKVDLIRRSGTDARAEKFPGQ